MSSNLICTDPEEFWYSFEVDYYIESWISSVSQWELLLVQWDAGDISSAEPGMGALMCFGALKAVLHVRSLDPNDASDSCSLCLNDLDNIFFFFCSGQLKLVA
eukprot:SAG31_NODE_9245_length_1308_cov_11.966088_1_plen_103_part_00